MTQFHNVAAMIELEDSGQMHVQIDEYEILLVAFEGEVYAIDYYCSHEKLTLEGGMVQNGCIICPYHGAEFALKDGSVLAPPAWEDLRSYPVKVEDNVIAVGVPS